MDLFNVLFFIMVVVVAAFVVIYRGIAGRKRLEALRSLADRLGLQFRPQENYSLGDDYPFLDRLADGDQRYAFNILSGTYGQHEVLVFDYHYATYSTSKGRRWTHHHYCSCFILRLPVFFPGLMITREDIFSKIGQLFGYDDIDFESHEFSRTFCVRSKDKRFAYDVCHPQMMEYLLANKNLNVDLEGHALALTFGGRLVPGRIEFNLQRLLEIRLRLPDYLFTRA